MPSHPKTVQLGNFVGINNTLRPERTDPTFLKSADNVNVDKSGGIQKRPGYALVDSGDYHSLWSDGNYAYGVKNDSLVRIHKNLTVEDLSVSIVEPVSFESIEGVVYYSSPSANGMLSGSTVFNWGVEEPNPKPTVASASGSLTAGRYQVAITYVLDSGVESGTSVAQYIDLSANSSIVLTNIPESSNSSVAYVRVYVSTPDGEVLYYTKDVTNGVTSTTINNINSAMLPLYSFNMKPAPKGHKVASYNGRALVAEDNVLWYSQPYSYHWFDQHKDYFVFPERIKSIMPVSNGIWIASDHIYYLSGDDFDTMKSDMKEPVKVIEGTEVRIPGHYIFIENTPLGYKWLVSSDKGIYILFSNGVILNMTERDYVMPDADIGTADFVQLDGINRYVSIVNKKGPSNNTAVGDQVTAEIIRNGVTLEE